MKHLLRKFDDSGSATMEFVIGLPLLVIAIIFIFEFGSLFWAHHIATYNVRSAIRFLERVPSAFISDPDSDFRKTADNIARFGEVVSTEVPDTDKADWMKDIDTTDISIDPASSTFTEDDGFRTAGQVIKIHMNVPFSMPTFGLANILSGGGAGSTVTFSIIEEGRYIGE